MPNSDEHFSIERQKQAVQANHFYVDLIAPCKVDSGLLRLANDEKVFYKNLFLEETKRLTFFIPASGSGSRMFEKVFEFRNNPTEETRDWVKNWMKVLPEMAIFQAFPQNIQHELKAHSISIEDFVKWLSEDKQLRIQSLPKGLLPFHIYPDGIKNAFHEHVAQGLFVQKGKIDFHFTIQSSFEQEIRKSLNDESFASDLTISFSEQSVDTNAVVFDEEFNLVKDTQGNVLTRPSGHGALLHNLDAIDAEIICIKNIDNVQHGDHMADSIEQWQILSGLLIEFRNRAKQLIDHVDRHEWLKFVEDFQLILNPEDWAYLSEIEIKNILNRPYRVCGMVKNEGQPGGGPFWVNDGGLVVKQIVEKAQINPTKTQLDILAESTHFNPVMLAVSPYSLDGQKLKLTDFVDNDQFFIVKKTHQGRPIKYIERPGLWNGSMAHWNTVFVEIPSEVFSPVKTITDLLDKTHLPTYD